MPGPRPIPATVAFIRAFAEFADRRAWLAVAVIALLGTAEVGGIVLLLPLLELGGIAVVGDHSTPFREVFARLAPSGFAPGLSVLLAVFIGLTLAQAAGRTALARLSAGLSSGFTRFLRERLHAAVVRAEWSAFLTERSARLVQTITGETAAAGNAAQALIGLFGALVQAGCQLVLALLISPAITGIAIAVAAIVGLAVAGINRRVRREGLAGLADRQALAANLTDHLAGIKVAKCHGAEAASAAVFSRLSASLGARNVRQATDQARARAVFSIGTAIGMCGVVACVFSGSSVRGAELALLGIVFLRLTSRLSAVQGAGQRFGLLLPSFSSTEELRLRLASCAAPAALVAPPPVPGRAVRFENVGFRYPEGADDAVRDISFDIPAGTTVALCGSSGAGKSTIADLALGLLRPGRGRILVDDRPLDDTLMPAWRAGVAYVPQETFLFDATVRENLTLLRPDADDAQLWAALEQAGAADLVKTLPRTLDTIVGERGMRLSGGERQRLALARALVRKPVLLVLDEATNALDPVHERAVRDAIDRLRGSLTILVVAHRLSTIRHADRIHVLDRGRLVQSGDWETLRADRDGLFARQLEEAAI